MGDSIKKTNEEIAAYWTRAQPAVASFISLMVPNFQDAADILQEVAVVVVKKSDQYNSEYPFVAWTIGIAKNEVLMHRRKYSKGRLILDTEAIQRISEVYEKESAKFNDMRKALDVCIKKLQGRGNQILEMRYLSELSISRIAQKLGMTHSSVYTSLHRIRLALRECINKQMASEELR